MRIDEAEQLVALLAGSYPHTIIGAETVMIYATALADLEPEEGAALVAKWLAHEKRWPSVAELRVLVARARGESAPDFDQAWREVRASFGVPPARRGRWSHPAIAEAVNAIGYTEIGASTEPEIMRAQFERFYRAAALRHPSASTQRFERRLAGEAGRGLIGSGVRELKGGS